MSNVFIMIKDKNDVFLVTAPDVGVGVGMLSLSPPPPQLFLEEL